MQGCAGPRPEMPSGTMVLGIHLYSHSGSANSRGCFLLFVKIIIVHKYQLSIIITVQ